MIKGNIKYNTYGELCGIINEAINFLKTTEFENKEKGRYYYIKGIFYMISEYETKEENEALYEAHRKYIDIQFIVKGIERIGYVDLSLLTEEVPYNEEKDIAFYSGNGEYITMTAGEYLVLFPEDGHKPCISASRKEHVKKVVFKIPLDMCQMQV